MRTYNSFEEIEYELKKIHLERKIAWEEIKQSTNKVQENLTPYNWVAPILDSAKRFGVTYLLKKLFKK